jgi:hypothetical protein
MNLDVGVISTLRSEVLQKTLTSFKQNLQGMEWNACSLYANIDSIGIDADKWTIQDVFQIIDWKQWWVNWSDSPSFPAAFLTVWDMLSTSRESKFALMLEDDWELLRKVDVQRIIDVMMANPSIAIVRLPMFPSSGKTMTNWNKEFQYDSRVKMYRCPKELKKNVGFCGHPSIISKAFIRRTVVFLDTLYDPELQFHGIASKDMIREVEQWDYFVYTDPEDEDHRPYVRDIGREWRETHSWDKLKDKSLSPVWEKKKV